MNRKIFSIKIFFVFKKKLPLNLIQQKMVIELIKMIIEKLTLDIIYTIHYYSNLDFFIQFEEKKRLSTF